ncbi:MAG: type II toxin-antitoxin system VapC family toxin [Rhodospirillaceae bacterium]
MSAFVLDCSVALAWAFIDEVSDYADAAMAELTAGGAAVVPGLWKLEVANALLTAERRGRATAAQCDAMLSFLGELSITETTRPTDAERVLALAREATLSAYDASYLQLARAEQLPLATLDAKLRDAAGAQGVATWRPTSGAAP